MSNLDLHIPVISEAAAPAAIVTWSAECPNWQRAALRRLCALDKPERADFDELLAHCTNDSAAGKPLTADHVRDASVSSAVVTLTAVHSLQHVNTLTTSQRLTFDKTGITNINGDNRVITEAQAAVDVSIHVPRGGRRPRCTGHPCPSCFDPRPRAEGDERTSKTALKI